MSEGAPCPRVKAWVTVNPWTLWLAFAGFFGLMLGRASFSFYLFLLTKQWAGKRELDLPDQ
jgi:hypothetical protein